MKHRAGENVAASFGAFGCRRGCGKNQKRSHSEKRSDAESLFLRAFKPRGIPLFARGGCIFSFFFAAHKARPCPDNTALPHALTSGLHTALLLSMPAR